jgi:putative glutamine transport system permease protein
MFSQAWSDAIHRVFAPKILLFLLQGLKNTMYIAVVTILLSLVFGTVLGLMRSGKLKPLRALAAVYIETVRNVPLTLFIIGMRFMTKLPPLESGIAAMTVFTSAVVAEIVRGGLNGVHPGQWEAAHSQGFGYIGAMLFVILPQALRRIRSPLTSQFVTTIKDTSFCALVGTYELSFTSKIAAAHKSIVTAEDILLICLLVAAGYYVVCSIFAYFARRQKEHMGQTVMKAPQQS